jgi:hypothetical protein
MTNSNLDGRRLLDHVKSFVARFVAYSSKEALHPHAAWWPRLPSISTSQAIGEKPYDTTHPPSHRH